MDEDVEKELEFDSHKIHWYWRRHLSKFLEILLNHPRAVVVLATSKFKKNAYEFLTKLRGHLETQMEWEEDQVKERMKWFED